MNKAEMDELLAEIISLYGYRETSRLREAWDYVNRLEMVVEAARNRHRDWPFGEDDIKSSLSALERGTPKGEKPC